MYIETGVAKLAAHFNFLFCRPCQSIIIIMTLPTPILSQSMVSLHGMSCDCSEAHFSARVCDTNSGVPTVLMFDTKECIFTLLVWASQPLPLLYDNFSRISVVQCKEWSCLWVSIHVCWLDDFGLFRNNQLTDYSVVSPSAVPKVWAPKCRRYKKQIVHSLITYDVVI